MYQLFTLEGVAIKGFAAKALKRLAKKKDSRGLPAQSVRRIAEILDILDGPNPMKVLSLPTYKLHPLHGPRKGCYAVSVNSNWRIVFRCDGEHAYEVDLIDYH